MKPKVYEWFGQNANPRVDAQHKNRVQSVKRSVSVNQGKFSVAKFEKVKLQNLEELRNKRKSKTPSIRIEDQKKTPKAKAFTNPFNFEGVDETNQSNKSPKFNYHDELSRQNQYKKDSVSKKLDYQMSESQAMQNLPETVTQGGLTQYLPATQIKKFYESDSKNNSVQNENHSDYENQDPNIDMEVDGQVNRVSQMSSLTKRLNRLQFEQAEDIQDKYINNQDAKIEYEGVGFEYSNFESHPNDEQVDMDVDAPQQS